MNRLSRICVFVFASTLCFGLVGCGDDDDVTSEDDDGIIAGTVTLEDADDHSGVLVTAGDDATTTTEADGSYAIPRLDAGEYDVTAAMDGYIDVTEQAEVEAGEETVIDFTLQPEPQAPVIVDVAVEPDVVFPGDEADVTVDAHDPDGGQLSYSFEAGNGFEIEDGDEDHQAVLTAPDEFDVQGQVTVTVEDDAGNTDERSVDVATETNDAPVIESISAVPGEFDPGQQGTLTVEAYDPQGSQLSYEWSAPEGWTLESDDEDEVTVTAPPTPAESATIEVAVSDEFDATSESEVDVTTAPSQPPEITELSVDPPQASPGEEIFLSVEAHDPDGSELDYHWSAPQDWTVVDGQQPQTSLIATDEYGATAVVTIDVIDEYGASATATAIVSTIENLGPRIESISADPTEVQRAGSIELYVDATHPDGDDLDYDWYAPGEWQIDEDPDAGHNPFVDAPDEPGLTDSVEVTVNDTDGATAEASILVRTRSNQAPVIDDLTANPASVIPNETVTIEASAYDPDGATLDYQWDVPSDWDGDSTSETLELTAPPEYDQTATIGLTVDDGVDTTTASVSVSTVPHLDPIIEDFSASPAAVDRGDSSQLGVQAFHPFGESLDYHWTLEDDEVDDPDEQWSLSSNDDEATLDSPDIPGESVTVVVEVTDDHDGSATATLTVITRENQGPNITDFFADPTIVDRGKDSELTVDATHDGDSLEYNWNTEDATHGGWELTNTASDSPTATLEAPDSSSESITVVVEVTDDHGDTTEASLVVETEANHDPYISSVTADPQILEPGQESTLTVDATDPNGESLSYDWGFVDSGDEDDWPLSESGNTATLTAPNDYEASTTVYVTVDDGYGGEATSEVIVTTVDE